MARRKKVTPKPGIATKLDMMSLYDPLDLAVMVVHAYRNKQREKQDNRNHEPTSLTLEERIAKLDELDKRLAIPLPNFSSPSPYRGMSDDLETIYGAPKPYYSPLDYVWDDIYGYVKRDARWSPFP